MANVILNYFPSTFLLLCANGKKSDAVFNSTGVLQSSVFSYILSVLRTNPLNVLQPTTNKMCRKYFFLYQVKMMANLVAIENAPRRFPESSTCNGRFINASKYVKYTFRCVRQSIQHQILRNKY